MATSELNCVMEAERSDGTFGTYYVYRNGSSYSITGPSGYSHICHESVKTIDGVKSEISLAFNAKVTKITPVSLLGK